MLQWKWTGGGHVFFAKYSCNLSYIFIKKKSYFTIIFVKSGSTPCTTLLYLLPIQIAFFSRLSLPSQNPKQETIE